MNEKVLENLASSVDKLNKNIERQTSFKFIIIRGLVYGISFVLGTTILAGIAISLLKDVPVVDDAIKKFEITDETEI